MYRLILIFWCLPSVLYAFDVNFKQTYPKQHWVFGEETSRLHKRNTPQFYDKATYTFDGLTRVASVPVPYPLDICILQLPTSKYAAALHKDKSGLRHFAIYNWQQNQEQYELLLQMPSPQAISLDCLMYAGRGYVALAYNLTESIGSASEGSPIYELSPETGIRTVQYFGTKNLRAMYLRISSQELTLLQTSGANSKLQHCPYFKWTGSTFQRIGSIPCSNARHLEPFGIDYSDYVAVANYADASGRKATYSIIYKYNMATRKFELFQRLRSNGAVDVKYFSVPINEVSRRHFLILGNTVGRTNSAEADTVFYVYDKGQFVPYQRLSFYDLQSVLPVQHTISEKFLLLVACNKQDVKIYNLNDWKFEESSVQFTEGAFSRGVSHMRSYAEGGQSYLVLSNELMAANETNIFTPLYKQDEHANILRQEIIEWAHAQMERLQSINVEQLVQAMQARVKPHSNLQTLSNVNIKRVNTQSLVDRRQNLTSNFWDALRYAKRALDVIEHEARTAFQEQPTPPQRLKRQAHDKPKELHEFDEITVGTLVVHDSLQAKSINGLDTLKPIYKSINASKVYVSEEYVEASEKSEGESEPTLELNVGSLQLEGKLNGYYWKQLVEQTLKRTSAEVQFIKAPAAISNLAAEAVLVNSKEVNGQSLHQLIAVDGGHYIVQQDVQFAEPIKVNRLQINDRLNNIHVNQQRFDVLLKEANWTQVIEGPKRLDSIRVLEPITVAGQMLGAKLRAMSPIKVTHQALQLQGNYIINGEVIVEQIIRATDLIDVLTNRSAATTLREGFRLSEPLQNINMRFEQPLRAKLTELSFINTEDLQHLVKLNSEEVQVVQGSKYLPQSLEISEGFGEVKWLNGIDVELLEQQLLLRDGNQTISVPVHVGGLNVNKLEASKIDLNGKPLTEYLSRTGKQQSNATLYVDQLHVLQVTANALHLNDADTILGHNLSQIYQYGSKSGSSFGLPPNFNGTLFATNLWLKSQINHVNVEDVENQLQQLAGNIKYVGDFQFKHPVSIGSLIFDGSLNGIASKDFGRCWLATSGDQNFTASQTIAGLESSKGLQLLGHLNNYTLAQLTSGCYRLNESELLKWVKFENPIVLQSELHTNLVNGLRIPEDIVYIDANTNLLQAAATVNAELLVSKFCNISSLNGIPLESLARYLNENDGSDTLFVEKVELTEEPCYETLNGHRVQQMLTDVWLANEQIVLGTAGQRVKMASASTDGLLEFEGNLNGLDLAYMKQNYFSRTRSQRINVALNFADDVTFTQPLIAGNVQLRSGNTLVEGIGNVSLDFDAFVANTLKTAGPHTVSGQWSMLEAYVPGELYNVHINELNLVTDVLRNDTGSKDRLIVTGPKTVQNAIVKRLLVTPTSYVASVPVAQWVSNAVYLYGNHSVAGTTILESVNLYNDLCVDGPVNGKYWRPDNLMLRDTEQHIDAVLHVNNTLPQQQRIMTNNIEDLWVDEINGLPVNEMLVNKARNRPNLHVEGQLIFEQPLIVHNYEVADDNGSYKWKRDTNAIENWQELLGSVKQRLVDPPSVLRNFMILQQLPLKATHVQTLVFQDMDVLAVWHRKDENHQMDYYVWQSKEQVFVANATLSKLLPPTKRQLDYLQNGFGRHWGELSTEWQPLCALHAAEFKCLVFNTTDHKKLPVYCVDDSSGRLQQSEHINISADDVKQLLPLPLATKTDVLVSLKDNIIDFWQWHSRNSSWSQQFQYQILTQNVKLIEFCIHDERSYLAVLVVSSMESLIQIYSADINDLSYNLEQTMNFESTVQPLEMQFMQLDKSKDLLLCVSSTSLAQSLQIYQHQGIVGFQRIMDTIMLPPLNSIYSLKLGRSQHEFLAAAGVTAEHGGVFLLEPQLDSL